MIASMLRLTRSDIKALKMTDAYSLHRVVYDLFDDVRTQGEKDGSTTSGILFVDKGGDAKERTVLILSSRQPREPRFGNIASKSVPSGFLNCSKYQFEVIVNPTKRSSATGKTVSVRGVVDVSAWFIERAQSSWGFSVATETLQVQILPTQMFNKDGHKVTQGSAHVTGCLEVTDRNLFIKSFEQGIGRGRAFGFGLLQIVPLLDS